MDDVLSGFRLQFWCCAVLLLLLTGPSSASDLQITEITIATPNMISVEVRDPQFIQGGIVELSVPVNQPIGTWIRHDGHWGMVVGPDQRHVRLADRSPATLLDRSVVDRAEDYLIDGRTGIAAVYRKSLPYDSGLLRSASGGTQMTTAMKHQIYLQLDQALEPGAHTIEWPDNLLPATTFVYETSKTRALAIRASQVGHGIEDSSKKAYLALWIPGGPDNGAVDFMDYGLNRFSVLDEKGTPVYASDILLKSLPNQEEPWNGLRSPLVGYAAVGGPTVSVTGITVAGAASITVPGHNFQKDDYIVLQRLSGDKDAAAIFATVGETSLETVQLLDIQGTLPATVEFGARAGPAIRANRSGTYVFELDYSDWLPEAAGTYQIRVDGLGVSDAFPVTADHWNSLGKIAVGGLYNHRSGVPLDGRFGYKRPAAFVPGKNLQIAKSALPLSFSSQGTLGLVQIEEAASPPWYDGKSADMDLWGGYMDAGDWDRHIVHLRVSRLFLDLADILPKESLNLPLGIPKSSEVLDRGLYAGTDDLPDILHEAIWNIDFYRRLQEPDGAVRGGIESAGHPVPGSVSYLEGLDVFAYSPDISSTYSYAALAAGLSRVLSTYNHQDLASTYLKSARDAWAAAETGFADIDRFYADVKQRLFEAGVSNAADWPRLRTGLEIEASDLRTVAASALYRTTGEDAFRRTAEKELGKDWGLYLEKSDAAWDYIQSEQIDPAIGQSLEELFKTEIALLLRAQETNTYPSMKHPYAPAGWGHGGPPDSGMAKLAMRAHALAGNKKIIELVQDTLNGLLGANQAGMSLMTGVGTRQIRHPLHEDHRGMGVTAPQGIVVYGWAPAQDFAYGWLFGPSWSPMAEVGLKSQSRNTRVEPSRFAIPYFENLIEFPMVVIQQEYTVHQTIGPVAALALFLNGQMKTD